MEELSKKIESMLEPVLEEERTYIDELGLEEEYNDIEDIPIDETEDIDEASKVIDVMNNVIDICQTLVEKKK